MTPQEVLFFSAMPQALPLYEVLRSRLVAEFPGLSIRAQKTQITFWERNGFGFVSLRRMKGCPAVFLIVSFGLPCQAHSPRILAAVEPYPNRWTHHVMVRSPEEIDEELLDWLRQAHGFALVK